MNLTGQNIIINFDDCGSIVSIVNKITGEVYPISDRGEFVLADTGKITAGNLVSADFTDTKAVFAYENFTVEYTVAGSYIGKILTITAPHKMTVEQVGILSLSFTDADDIHYHDDCTIWHCPMCTYARHKKGGVYYGLAYPYWDSETEMAFSPWMILEEGEEFTSEMAFLGVFEKTGKIISSHGPYPGAKKLRYHDGFNQQKSGLPQHFPEFKIPEDVGIPEEEQDAGEVAAMRRFFKDYLGEYPLPEEGYFVWQNGWWAGLNNADTEAIDVMKRIGVNDIMTAAMYFGHANHPSCQPNFITDMLFDPIRFPKVADQKVEITTLEDGHHHDEEVVENQHVTEYTEEFSAPAEYDELIRYGRENGIYVTSFSTPNNSYANYPQWLSLDKDGNPYEYFRTKVSCPASKEFMDHHFEMLCAVLDKYRPRMFFFDGRWMGFREIACGYPSIGEDPCFAENHGHLPGKSRYMEWKNIEEFKKRLRERYPDMCFEQYYGLKRGSTWALSYFNGDENYYEVGNPDDLRFQAWHNEMDRFRPTNMHFANIMAKDFEKFKYAMISTLSTSSDCQLASSFHVLKESDECVQFFKKWRSWASENARYLQHKENLFGCPGDVKIDGSAHIIDGEGWLFLFNVMDTDEVCEFTLSEIPDLHDASYKAEQVYPAEAEYSADNGVMRIPVDAHNAAIIRLTKI